MSGGVGISAAIKAFQDIVAALNSIRTLLSTQFPTATASISNTATGGGQTLPANPQGFLTINVNGVAYKVPIYNP